MDVPSQQTFWEWARTAAAAVGGGLLVGIFKFVLDSRKLPAEIQRTETESIRIEAEAGKVRAEGKRIEVESQINLAQTIFEMSKQIVAENKLLKAELVERDEKISRLTHALESKDRALVAIERELRAKKGNGKV